MIIDIDHPPDNAVPHHTTVATQKREGANTRRSFLRKSGAAAAGVALAPRIAGAYAGESNTIKVALIGCGGRGTGAAANALTTSGPVQLWAMADVFPERLRLSHQSLEEQFTAQVDVPDERRFIGFDAYRRAIDTLDRGDVVLLATPPAFRPLHLEYAVDRGVHVFMEKSFAVDAPGVRRVLAAGRRAAENNVKIAGGLMERHYPPLEAAMREVHEGAIGPLITTWVYRKHGPVGFRPRDPGMSELLHQIRNYSNFTWLNGSFFLDWLIHNLDVACWAKQAWPISAQGDGGRQVRDEPDQLFDHYSIEFAFPDGTRMMAQGRHIAGCWSSWGNVLHGTKGSALVGEGVPQPKLFNDYVQSPAQIRWRYDGPDWNPYQVEHDRFFSAIRNDDPYNETERCAFAALTGILGRMAAESGKLVTWEQALASNVDLAPGIDDFTMDSPAPVMPGPDGRYPIAMPGTTEAV